MIKILRTLRMPVFEFLYVLYSFEFPWRFKLGYSWEYKKRRAQIQESMSKELGRKVNIHILFAAPVLFAYPLEQGIHKLFHRLRCVDMVGSGRTEWFKYANIFGYFLVWAVCSWKGIDDGHIRAMIVLIAPLPIDIALLVLLVAVVEYGLIGYGIWSAFKFVLSL